MKYVFLVLLLINSLNVLHASDRSPTIVADISTHQNMTGHLDIITKDEHASPIDVRSEVDEQTHTLRLVFDKFTQKRRQFDYGRESMEELYNTSDPASFYTQLTPSTFFENCLTFFGVIAGTVCNVTRCLSLSNPEVPLYGTILTGSHVAKAVFYGVGARARAERCKSFFDLLNVFHCSPRSISHLTDLCAQANEVSIEKVRAVAASIVDIVEKSDMYEEWKQKCARLDYLNTQLAPPGICGRLIAFGSRSLSFLTGVTAGVAIAVSGQMSPTSYWLTLVAGGIDPIVDGLNITSGMVSKVRKYIMVCEMLYLCDNLLKVLTNDQFRA
ncbi:MAG: hypothetical protein LBB34_04045 [Holosporales bacterium]|jgi:hypothetical protein|nr:hypothetical protein [Holosporales bacterium]